jgi:uncharacterized membrane protein YhaH (DUF805 family)
MTAEKVVTWLFYVLPQGLEGIDRAVSQQNEFLTIFTLMSLGLSLWCFVELGFLRGTAGPNRFGLDPRDAASAPALASGPAN